MNLRHVVDCDDLHALKLENLILLEELEVYEKHYNYCLVHIAAVNYKVETPMLYTWFL
jgi:hypothetical protein